MGLDAGQKKGLGLHRAVAHRRKALLKPSLPLPFSQASELAYFLFSQAFFFFLNLFLLLWTRCCCHQHCPRLATLNKIRHLSQGPAHPLSITTALSLGALFLLTPRIRLDSLEFS